MAQIHIGILGAARIVPSALLSPAKRVSEVAIGCERVFGKITRKRIVRLL